MDAENNKGKTKMDKGKYFTGVLLTLLGISLGFSASYVGVIKDVGIHATQINQIIHQADIDRNSFEERFKAILSLMEKQTEQSRDLITLLKLQQQLKP